MAVKPYKFRYSIFLGGIHVGDHYFPAVTAWVFHLIHCISLINNAIETHTHQLKVEPHACNM